MGRCPLLSRDEVLHLSRLIQRHRAANTLNHPRAVRSVNRLVRGNLRLVVHVWRCSFTGRIRADDHRLPDLLQEGAVGLHRAAQLYDPERGYEFATYASHWIRKGFFDFLRDQNRTIRLPAAAARAVRVFAELSSALPSQEQHDLEALLPEVARLCRASVPTVRMYLRQAWATDAQSISYLGRNRGEEPTELEIPDPRQRDLEVEEEERETLRRFDLLASRAHLDPFERVLLLARADGANNADLAVLCPGLRNPGAHASRARVRLRHACRREQPAPSLSLA